MTHTLKFFHVVIAIFSWLLQLLSVSVIRASKFQSIMYIFVINITAVFIVPFKMSVWVYRSASAYQSYCHSAIRFGCRVLDMVLCMYLYLLSVISEVWKLVGLEAFLGTRLGEGVLSALARLNQNHHDLWCDSTWFDVRNYLNLCFHMDPVNYERFRNKSLQFP